MQKDIVKAARLLSDARGVRYSPENLRRIPSLQEAGITLLRQANVAQAKKLATSALQKSRQGDLKTAHRLMAEAESLLV